MFTSILTNTTGTLGLQNVLFCSLVAIGCGLIIASVYKMEGNVSSNFIISLVLLPVLVQCVIMLVNGNLGTSVAVLGTFGLVRFRSAPGTSKDICYIFFAMAIGLATGMGYLTFAILICVMVSCLFVLLVKTKFNEDSLNEKELHITIPESIDYMEIFDDLFDKYTKKSTLKRVKTTNMGTMYDLIYRVTLIDCKQEKAFIDEIRTRNGNLSIVFSRPQLIRDEL